MKPLIVKLSSLFSCMFCTEIVTAQTKTAAQIELPALYGCIVSRESKSLNTLCGIGIILPDTKPEKGPLIRAKIYKRLIANFGMAQVELKPVHVIFGRF